MDIKKVSVIGIGKLGACMLASIASKGIKVIGVDNNAERVKTVNQGHAPLFEPRLEQFFRSYKEKISATTDYRAAVLNSDISFIVVPTPSLPSGEFSLSSVIRAVKELGKALDQKKSYHIIILTSTVLPGTMENCIKPILEKYSGKKCIKDFGLCYNPEFIALGTVIKNFLNPDFVLIGESDKNSGFFLEKFYRKVCENKPVIARMDFINAELTKISVNSFVTTKITFANMLALISQRLPGGNVDVVTKALGLDSRIGNRYLKGGLGFGGPCFPRDNSALFAVARKLGVEATIPKATDELNRKVILSVFKLIAAKAKKKDSIGILGLSYKPLSNVIEESQPVFLAKKLLKSGYRVVLYDPLAMDNLKMVFGKKVSYAKSAEEAVRDSDILIIANPDPEFLKIKKSTFLSLKKRLIIIDCWRILYSYQFFQIKKIEYLPFGVGRS